MHQQPYPYNGNCLWALSISYFNWSIKFSHSFYSLDVLVFMNQIRHLLYLSIAQLNQIIVIKLYFLYDDPIVTNGGIMGPSEERQKGHRISNSKKDYLLCCHESRNRYTSKYHAYKKYIQILNN